MKKLFTILMLAVVPFLLRAQDGPFVKRIGFAPGFTHYSAKTKSTIPVKKYALRSNEEVKPSYAGDTSIIGTTTYDLQTNNSSYRRIVLHPDHTVSAIWTMSHSFKADTYSDRGTGYNTKDVNGVWGSFPLVRVEGPSPTRRCGFPSLSVNPANDNEIIVVHTVPPPGGISDTTFLTEINTPANRYKFTPYRAYGNGRSSIWNRASAGGNNFVYTINNYNPPSSNDPDVKDPRNGVVNPTYFHRSKDGGVTFVDTFQVLPGYDSTRYDKGSADVYAIDSRDSVVVVGIGQFDHDIAIWKSTKYGEINSFQKMVIDSFTVYGKNVGTDANGDGTPDTLRTIASEIHVLVDPKGVAHAFWSEAFAFDQTGTVAKQNGFPGNAIYHWDDLHKQITVVGSSLDIDGDGIVQQGSDWNTTRYGFGYALCPTAGYDSAGNLYCAFACMMENDTTDDQNFLVAGRNFSDIYISTSADGGLNWTPQINLSNYSGFNTQVEDMFPSMAINVDKDVHLIWQQASEPGIAVASAGGPPPPKSPETCGILYMQLDTATAKGHRPPNNVGIKNSKLENVTISAFPNPAKDEITFSTNLDKNMNVELNINNILGQEVMNVANGNFTEGKHNFKVNLAAVPAGIYFYTLKSNGQSVTKKIVVAK